MHGRPIVRHFSQAGIRNFHSSCCNRWACKSPYRFMFGPLAAWGLAGCRLGWPKGSFCADIELLHTIDTIVPSTDAPSSVGYTPTSPTCILKATCSTYLECHPMSAKFTCVSAGARTCVFHPELQRLVFCSLVLPCQIHGPWAG